MPFTPRLFLITAPNLGEARHLAKVVLESHLAACVNLVPGVESHYWWRDQLESSAEVLLLIKSSAEHFEVLRELVALHHSYECPEVITFRPEEIAPAYRAWWEAGVTSA